MFITGRGGLKACEMLRIPHCLDSRLTDGGKVGSLMCRQSFYSPHSIFMLLVLICYRLRKFQGLVRPEVLRKLIKINCFIGSRTLDLPACSIMLHPIGEPLGQSERGVSLSRSPNLTRRIVLCTPFHRVVWVCVTSFEFQHGHSLDCTRQKWHFACFATRPHLGLLCIVVLCEPAYGLINRWYCQEALTHHNSG
jgi:hypothetical protein